jgi:hypothetical protein
MTLKQSDNSCVKPASGYRTSDGKMYATYREAVLEQHTIDIRKEVASYMEGKHLYYNHIYPIIEWERYKKEQELKND